VLPRDSSESVAAAARQLAESDNRLATSLTNLSIVEERKAVTGDLRGRLILATRTNGNRVFTFFFFLKDRGVFLFAERAGESLTMEDPAARQFFHSVEVTAK
jgi:hypothetical protein